MAPVAPSVPSRRIPRPDVRAAVIAAAGRLFLSRGYAATTIDQVAHDAGFTKGAVYSNFAGKPELFAAAVSERFSGRTSAAVEAAALLSDGSAPEPAALAEQLAALVTGDGWSPLMAEFRAVARNDPAVAVLYTDLRGRQQAELAERLRGSGERLHLRPGLDLDVAALLLLTVVNGLAVEYAAAPTGLSIDQVRASFEQLLQGWLQ